VISSPISNCLVLGFCPRISNKLPALALRDIFVAVGPNCARPKYWAARWTSVAVFREQKRNPLRARAQRKKGRRQHARWNRELDGRLGAQAFRSRAGPRRGGRSSQRKPGRRLGNRRRRRRAARRAGKHHRRGQRAAKLSTTVFSKEPAATSTCCGNKGCSVRACFLPPTFWPVDKNPQRSRATTRLCF
jgi:hypothetical protein